jgi:GT2 family glycosyltransferase
MQLIDPGANLGFGKANNIGLGLSTGRYILFVNPDVIFLTDIIELVDQLKKDLQIGIIGPLTYRNDCDILPSCGEFPTVRNYFSQSIFLNNIFPRIRWWGNFAMRYFCFKGTREVDWLSGAFMLGRKEVFDKINGFDEDFFMYCEDIDICWRLKKLGFKIIFCDKVSIIHTSGHSVQNMSVSKAKLIAESSGILWSKHYSSGTVKKLFAILCLGSILRKIIWLLLNLIKISKRRDMSAYYKTIISESINYLKG